MRFFAVVVLFSCRSWFVVVLFNLAYTPVLFDAVSTAVLTWKTLFAVRPDQNNCFAFLWALCFARGVLYRDSAFYFNALWALMSHWLCLIFCLQKFDLPWSLHSLLSISAFCSRNRLYGKLGYASLFQTSAQPACLLTLSSVSRNSVSFVWLSRHFAFC